MGVSSYRSIGSLVLGRCENGELTKNTLSAIHIAKSFGPVGEQEEVDKT